MRKSYQNVRFVWMVAIGISAIAVMAVNHFSTQAHRAGFADEHVIASSCALQTFSPVANLSAGTLPVAVAAADFNADGKIDLAVTESGADQVLILLGNGKGGFTATGSFFVGANPNAIVAGDFNADGRLDLAVANTDTDDIS